MSTRLQTDDAARRLMSLGRNEVILVEECQSKHELETTFKKYGNSYYRGSNGQEIENIPGST